MLWFSDFILPGVPPALFWLFCSVSVIIQGISKSGFAGGAGILSLPLLMLVMPVDKVAGTLLPILILCDMNAIYHHWRNKVWRLVMLIFIPSLVGTIPALVIWYVVGKAGVEQYGVWIKVPTGVLAVIFALYILAKEMSMQWVEKHKAGTGVGVACGVAAGFTSTLIHAAGPIVSLFMFSQHLGKTMFTGTVAWTFALINGTKFPFYCIIGLINWKVILFALVLSPLVPIGSFTGKWMHDHVSESAFNWVVLVLTLIFGVQLVCNVNLIQMGLQAAMR
jgi:uncharacterized membrane protein YfcA